MINIDYKTQTLKLKVDRTDIINAERGVRWISLKPAQYRGMNFDDLKIVELIEVVNDKETGRVLECKFRGADAKTAATRQGKIANVFFDVIGFKDM